MANERNWNQLGFKQGSSAVATTRQDFSLNIMHVDNVVQALAGSNSMVCAESVVTADKFVVFAETSLLRDQIVVCLSANNCVKEASQDATLHSCFCGILGNGLDWAHSAVLWMLRRN